MSDWGKTIVLCVAALATLAHVHAAYPAHKALLEDSPFLPPAKEVKAKAPVRPVPSAPAVLAPEISFHGAIRSGGQYMLSLHNSKTDEQSWCQVGENVYGYTLVSYQADSHRVILRKDGKDYPLYLSNIGEIKRTAALIGEPKGSVAKDEEGLVKFTSLSPEEQKKYNDPAYVSMLEERSIEVPASLRQMRGGHRTSASAVGGGSTYSENGEQPASAEATTREPRPRVRFPTPRVNTSHTRAEREQMAKAAQGG